MATAQAMVPAGTGPSRLVYILGSAILHAAVLVLILTRTPPPRIPEPRGETITVSMAPMAVSEARTVTPAPVTAPTTPPVVPVTPAPTPPPTQAAAVAPPAAPPPALDPQTATQQAPENAPVQALPITPPPEKPDMTTARVQPTPEPRRPVTRRAPPPTPQRAEPRAEPQPAEPSAPANAQPAPQQSAPQERGDPKAAQTYSARLASWLEQNKRYPRQAELRRIEGTALLYFRMDRNGRVITASLRNSSGSTLLDDATMDMLQRAQPLPKPPAEMTDAQLSFVVPVRFNLR